MVVSPSNWGFKTITVETIVAAITYQYAGWIIVGAADFTPLIQSASS
jgi:hypothetical protein